MQSKKNEEPKKEMSFPGLYESKSSGAVYLLQSRTEGACIFSDTSICLGHHYRDLSVDITWIPYRGSVTLGN